MKKSFLLLLLLTLLPLAGWADDPSAVTGLKYTGSAQTVAHAGSDYYTQYRYAITTGTQKPSWSQSSTSLPTALGAGTYRVYWASRYGGAVREYQEWNAQNHYFTVTIEKAEATVKGFQINKTWDNGVTDPTVADFTADPALYQVTGDATWDLVKGYLTFARVDEGTDVGSYFYTFDVASEASANLILHIDNAAAKLNIQQATNVVVDANKVTIADWTYGETASTPANDNAFKYGNDQVVYTYAVKGTTDFTDQVPTEAGEYTLKATVPEHLNYAPERSVTVNFEIKKANLTPVAANVAEDIVEGLVYTGSPLKLLKGEFPLPEFNGTGYSGTFEYFVDGVSVGNDWNAVVGKNADEDVDKYEITYTFVPNSNNFNPITVQQSAGNANIAKAELGDMNPALAAIDNLVFDNTDQVLITAGAIANGKVMYKVGDGAWTENVNDITGKNAGTYNVSYYYKSTSSNYKDSGSGTSPVGSLTGNAAPVIAKANFDTYIGTSPTAFSPAKTYTGSNVRLLSKGFEAKISGVTIPCDMKYTVVETSANFTGYTDVVAVNAGVYTVNYKVTAKAGTWAENNFNDYEGTVADAKIAKAPLDIAAQPIQVDWTGNPVVLADEHYAKGDPTDFVAGETEAEQYAIVNTLVKLKSIEGATTEKPIPTDAGYYKFELAKADPDPTPCNYVINTFSPEGSLQINKVASTPASVAAADLTYTGGKLTLLQVTGEAKGGTMKYYLAASETETAPATDSGKWVDAIPQGQEAGKYYVYSYVKGDKNHNDTAPVKTTAEIKAKSLTGMTVAFTPAEATYNGSAVTVAVSVKDGTKDLDPTTEFGVKKIEFGSATVTEIKAAGTYTYTIEGKGNYTGQITSPFKVKQAANEVEVKITGWKYGATPNKPQATVKFGDASKVVFTYAKNEATPTFVADVPTEVGDYIVKGVLAGTTDYAVAEGTAEFSIDPVDPAIEQTVALTVVYNGANQALAKAATSTDGTFTYAAVAAGAEAPADAAYTADIPVELNAGQYDVYTKFTPDGNHNAATVNKVIATIEKKNIGIMLNTLDESIEANIITYNGEAVPMNAKLWTIYAPSDLPGVDANLPVNDRPFSFKFPAEVKNAGDYEFTELTPVWKDEKVQNYTFTFSQAAKFTVHPKKLDKAMITLDPDAGAYVQGKKYTVKVTVADGDPSILVFGDKDAAKNDVNYVIKNGDATVANGSIEAAGTYNFVFTAQNNYEGEVTVPFVVGTKSIVDLLQPANWDDVVYNGKPQAPTIVLKDKKNDGKDYTLGTSDYELKITYPAPTAQNPGNLAEVKADDVKDARTYTFTITGKGNYSGTISKTKTITRKPLRDDDKQKDFSMPASAEYIALGQMPAITAKSEVEALVEGKDYEVWVDGAKIDTKKDKLNEAKAYAFEFKGIGNYTASVTRTFTITKATVIVTASSYTKKYNGKNGVEGAKVVGGGDAWTYSGLKNYDGFDPALVQAAEGALTVKPNNNQTKDVGTYQLVVDASKFTYGVEPGVNNYNFIVADEQGTLTIEPTPIVLGFDTEKKDNSGNTVPAFITKEYGVKDADFFSKNNQFVEKFVKVKAAEDDSPIAAELAGLAYELKSGNKVVHPAGLAFSRDNKDVEAVGKYTGVVTMTYDKNVFSNYAVEIQSTKGNFEIAKAVLTIALKDDIEVIYDGAVPTEEVASISNDKLAVSGKQWNDDYSVIKNVKGTIVNPSEHVGSYVVKLEAEAENYTVVTLDARIIIREAPLTVTIADQTINKTPVKDVNNMLKTSKAATVKGIVGNDDIKATMVVANGVDTQAPGAKDPGVKFTIANTDYKLVDAKGNKLDAVYGKLIVLADGYEIALNDAAAYNQAKKETHNVTFTTRSVNQDTWNVCVLPFETTPAEVSDMFGYAVVDLLNKDANDGNIHFVVTTSGVIPAGTPFVFKPTKDAAGAVTDFDQVVFQDVEVLPLKDFATKELFVEGGNTYAKDAANNKFWGTFKETTFEGKKFWYMSKGDWKDASQRSVTLKSYRAYVEFDEANVAAGARIFVEEADGTITAIKGIDANGQLIAADGWYTVNGVKLNAAPTQKGTYIKDGKKVFVK